MKNLTMTMTVVLGIGTGLAGFVSARALLSPWRSIVRSSTLTVMVGDNCAVSMRVANQVLSTAGSDSSCRVAVVPVTLSQNETIQQACEAAVEISAIDGAGAIAYLPAELACRWLVADGLSKYEADGQVALPIWYRDGEVLDRDTQMSLTKAALSGQPLCELAT